MLTLVQSTLPFDNPNEIYDCGSLQVITATLILFANSYMLIAFLLYKKLRQLQFFMILVQLVVDLVGCGIGGVLLYAVEISKDWNWGVDYDYEHKLPPVDVSINVNFHGF